MRHWHLSPRIRMVWAPEQARGVWARGFYGSTPAGAGVTTSVGWPVRLQSCGPPPLYQSTHYTKVSLLVPGLPSLPESGIPEDSDLVLFICRSPVPGIAPGSWWALNKCLLKEEWVNVIGKVYNPGIVINSKLIPSQFLAVAYGHITPCIKMIYEAWFNTTAVTYTMK